jgi:uncharacterized phiE125 gp8 family phage protein
MRPTRVSGPTESAVSVADAKENTRIDFSDEDALVQRKIDAAIADLDGYNGILGRCICNQVWRMPFACFGSTLKTPFFDVSAVILKYWDAAGVEQIVSSGDYLVIEGHTGAYLHFIDYATPETQEGHPQPVWAEVTTGYGGASDVPGNVKEAIYRLVDHWYENRGDIGDNRTVPMGFDHIVAKIRRVPV